MSLATDGIECITILFSANNPQLYFDVSSRQPYPDGFTDQSAKDISGHEASSCRQWQANKFYMPSA